MSNIKTLGIDLAKNVFQLHGIDGHGKKLLQKRLSRTEFIEFMGRVDCDVVVMEACGGANHWARRFTALGHQVKLISPQFVKPYLKSNKNDAKDAEAICEAASRENMVFVHPKDLKQQDIQSAHRIRQGYVENRTALGNRIRGLLQEYGIVVSLGIAKLRKELMLALGDAGNELTSLARRMLNDLYGELMHLEEKVAEYDKILEKICKEEKACQRLLSIPGIGVMTATCFYATIGDGKLFDNGRHVSAYLGLVPKQHSSGNKQRLLGISKRGDRYLRSLLTHGGRSIMRSSDKKSGRLHDYARRLKQTKHSNKVAIALANKMARTAWAVLRSGQVYQEAI